jgi:HEAT repeat protein
VPLVAAVVLCCEYLSAISNLNPLIDKLNTQDTAARDQAIESIGKFGAPAINPLVSRLTSSGSPDERAAIAMALSKLGEPAIEPLLNCAKGAQQEPVREAAADALASMTPPPTDKLLSVLKDPDSNVQQTAILALGKAKEATAVEPLTAFLSDGNPSAIQQSAVEALGSIGQPAAYPLVTFVEQQDSQLETGTQGIKSLPNANLLAVQAFAKIGDPAVDALAEMLNSGGYQDPSEGRTARSFDRWTAAEALGEIKATRVIEALKAVSVEDSSPEVRRSASAALAAIRGQSSHASSRDNSEGSSTESKDEEAAAHIARAKEFWSSGETGKALKECDAALRLSPDNEEAATLRDQYAKAIDLLNGTSQ